MKFSGAELLYVCHTFIASVMPLAANMQVADIAVVIKFV